MKDERPGSMPASGLSVTVRWAWLVLALTFAPPLVLPALADPRPTRLGNVTVTHDDRDWTAIPLANGDVGFEPVGPGAAVRDPVRLTRRADTGCEALARDLLPPALYDDPHEAAADGTAPGLRRFRAPMRCRNRQPEGVVLCLADGAGAVALAATVPSCRSPTNRHPGGPALDGFGFGRSFGE